MKPLAIYQGSVAFYEHMAAETVCWEEHSVKKMMTIAILIFGVSMVVMMKKTMLTIMMTTMLRQGGEHEDSGNEEHKRNSKGGPGEHLPKRVSATPLALSP